MSYQLYATAAFGTGKAGLTTVGYRLYDVAGAPATARIHSGVQDLGGGQYGALVSFPPGFRGRLSWDTGETVPRSAHVGVNPEEGEYLDASVAAATGRTTPEGTVPVDHDYGGPDALAYRTEAGAGIAGATIDCYLTADYAAGNRARSYILGSTATDAAGRWLAPIALYPGNYTLLFAKAQAFNPSVVAITVAP